MSNLNPVYLSEDEEEYEDKDQEVYNELKKKEDELLKLKSNLKQKLQTFNIETYLNNVNLIQIHSNLPSLNFDKRLETVKLFYPDMIISNESNKVLHYDDDVNDDNDELKKTTILEFTLCFKILLKFNIKITINGYQIIEDLEIKPINLNSVLEASDIFTLIERCKDTKDISLFIHSINVFYKLQQTRLKTFINLFDLFIGKAIVINEIENKNENTNAKNNENKYIKFKRFSNKSNFKIKFNNQEYMTIQWKLQLNTNNDNSKSNKWTFENNISCYLFNNDNELIENLTDIATGLIKTNGTFRSLATLIENILSKK